MSLPTNWDQMDDAAKVVYLLNYIQVINSAPPTVPVTVTETKIDWLACVGALVAGFAAGLAAAHWLL